MSEWGAALTAIEAELRIALPDLPAGINGFERLGGHAERLDPGRIPHVFVNSIIEAADIPVDGYGVETVTTLYTLALWTHNEDQEAVALRMDAIRTQIRANRTLGGAVDSAFVAARGIEEQSDRNDRRAEFIVQTEVSG